ncbi:MAG TPA: protein kinase, partial [Herpetosiphonaceae bacterium]
MTNQSQPRVLNNRFQLDRKLGQGGMATVYLGRDLRLGRPVAVKILHGQYAGDDQFLRRFKHEADAAAQLGHPNIVRVYDVGSDGDLHYIVMEYINGADLKEIISREAPLAIPRTLKLVQQIAEALEAAHRSGLVHRDIKPQNVLVDGEDQVHLSDFGIAKSDRSSAYTDPGTTFGTADYLAPEQAQGLGATPRSDIYALGVVTYEMLTGRLPFAGDTPLAVAMQHVQSPPPPPRQFNPAIPPQLEAIVLQAMAKDPNQRPASARAFAELLRTYRERGNQQTTV